MLYNEHSSGIASVLELMGKHTHNKQLSANKTLKTCSRPTCFINMVSKCALTLLLLPVFAVELSTGRQVSLVHRRGIPPSKSALLDLPRNRNGFTRGRRCLGTALSLLWPQVVGPVEQGVIEERNYNEVPKTLLEHRLDLIRKKALEEEESRLLLRSYMKKLTEAQDEFYGFSNGNLLSDDYT